MSIENFQLFSGEIANSVKYYNNYGSAPFIKISVRSPANFSYAMQQQLTVAIYCIPVIPLPLPPPRGVFFSTLPWSVGER